MEFVCDWNPDTTVIATKKLLMKKIIIYALLVLTPLFIFGQKQTQEETPQKEQTISNMEERKWQKLLNDREINTLLLPLTKGDNNEKQPW